MRTSCPGTAPDREQAARLVSNSEAAKKTWNFDEPYSCKLATLLHEAFES